MILERLVVGPFQSNCWILGCVNTHEGVLIDPGDEADRILKAVKQHGLTLRYIIHTHGHLDHVGAMPSIKQATGAEVLIHEADRELLEMLPLQASMFGLPSIEAPPADQYLQEGDTIRFGDHQLAVIETPGHSPGGICLQLESDLLSLFVGDTLFQGSIGRTDLWGGSYSQLIQSIRVRLCPLDETAILHPGHGPSTTLGQEKQSNPFLQE